MSRLFILTTLVLLCTGCGSGKPVPISGRVTLNGKPLANAAVLFNPVAAKDEQNPGPGSTGTTDDDGHYTLSIVGKTVKGAVIGKHKVQIVMSNTESTDTADDRPKRSKPTVRIPPRYHSKDSKLEFEVTSGGSDSANFDLTSP